MAKTDTAPTRTTTDERKLQGRNASQPLDIPSEGWKQVLLRVKDEIKNDNVALMAGGVAFYAMLALFPAMVAAVTIWGLVADPATIQSQVQSFASALPAGAGELLTDQMTKIAGSSNSALGWGVVIGVLGALWSASSGTKGLMNAINSAYDEVEGRNFLKVRGLALTLTLGGVFFALILVGLIAVVPAVLEALPLAAGLEWVIDWGRWPLLALFFVGGLAVLYRFAPDRDQAQWSWVSWGALAATAIWLVASAGFSLYVSLAGSYQETYGSIAGVIVLMMWLFLSAFAILIGAELNAELEHQTRHDTTVGEPQPMGDRGAYVADTRPDPS